MSLDTNEYRHRAMAICGQLGSIPGLSNRVAIPAAKVRLMITEQRIDPAQLSATLLQIVRLPVLAENSFRM